jgi:hypothetical protein
VIVLAKSFVCLVLAFFLCASSAVAPAFAQGADQSSRRDATSKDDEQVRQDMEKEMAKKQNKQRQEALKKDTDHLMELATELKKYVDKSNENLLSLEVVRKAEEIEKLAHRVKEKMKGE